MPTQTTNRAGNPIPRQEREPQRVLSAVGVTGDIDRENHIIYGVAMAALGAAKDKRLIVDETFLQQLAELGNKRPIGIKSRFDHPAASGTSMGTYLGRLRDWRIDGGTCRADLHLSRMATKSPDKGDMRAYVEDLAEEDPAAFGMSVVVSVKERIFRRDENGKPLKDEDGEDLPPLWRIRKLWAGDVVDEPNLNDELFSVIEGTPAQKAADFLDRYLDSKGLSLVAADSGRKEPGMSTKANTASVAAEQAAGTGASAVAEATNEQQGQTASPPATPQANSTVGGSAADSPIDAQRRSMQSAVDRVLEIQGHARRLGLDDYGQELCRNLSLTTAEACRMLLQRSAEKNPPIAQANSVQVVADARDKFRGVLNDAFLMRAGLDSRLSEQRRAEVATFAHRRLLDIGRIELERNGVRPADDELDLARQMLGYNTTSSDMPLLMGTLSNSAMMAGWEEEGSTWQEIMGTKSVRNFDAFREIQVSESDDLLLVKENGEYKTSTIGEAYEEGQVAKFGRLFDVTLEMIMGDKFDQIIKQPMRFGASSRRLEGDLVYSQLLGSGSAGTAGFGPTLIDGSQLILSSGANYISGANTALDATYAQAALQAAILKMRKFRGLKGKARLAVRPEVLLLPPELEMQASILLDSTSSISSGANAGVKNPWKGIVRPVVESRLSDTTFSDGASTTHWYLVGRKAMNPVGRVAHIAGRETPRLTQEEGFTRDGRTYKIQHFVGTIWLERRSIVRSKGAA